MQVTVPPMGNMPESKSSWRVTKASGLRFIIMARAKTNKARKVTVAASEDKNGF